MATFLTLNPSPTTAEPYIGITATGSDNAALPGFPIPFTATANTDNVLLSWTLGSGATTTYIIRAIGYQPTSLTDGILIYSGTGTSHTDNISTGDLLDGVYYSAWGHNAVGYSTSYATAYIEGGNNMANAIIISILMIIGLATLIFAYTSERWPLAFISAVFWLAATVTAFVLAPTPANYYDTYHLTGYACLLMIVACAYEPVYAAGRKVDDTDDSGYSPSEQKIMAREKKVYGRMDAITRFTSKNRKDED